MALVSPYIDAIKFADDIINTNIWVNQVFQGNVLSTVRKSINLYRQNMKNTVDDMKQAIIVGLIRSIFYYESPEEIAYEIVNPDEIKILTPWNIKGLLEQKGSKETAKYFGVEKRTKGTETTLPVNVTIGINSYTHDMSFNLVLGILAFYNFLQQKHPLSMFGCIFSDHDNIINNMTIDATDGYTVTVGTITYFFDDKDFMRGLLTAAMWTGIDPHQYITNLTELKRPNNYPIKLPDIGEPLLNIQSIESTYIIKLIFQKKHIPTPIGI